MGPFGASSHYSLCFFIPFHPKPPPSLDLVQAVSLADAWRGVGLTYLLLKGLKRTSTALKLIRDTAPGCDKGSWGSSLTARSPAPFSPDELTEKSLKGFGLGLEGVMTTIRGISHAKSEVKEIVTVVKTADRVFEVVKVARGVIGSPVGELIHALGCGGNGVLLGFKVVLKGVKISKGFVTVTRWCSKKQDPAGPIGAAAEVARRANKNRRFAAFVKGLKASEAAVNIVKITKEAAWMFDKMDHLLSWSVLMKGFNFTKSAIRVLEPLSMMSTLEKGVLEIKGVVEGFSVVMKAVALSKELLRALIFAKDAMVAFNRRTDPEYSHRTEVSFNSSVKQPAIAWSLTKANSSWEHTKDVGFLITTAETLWYVEDNTPLPLSFLMLAISFT